MRRLSTAAIMAFSVMFIGLPACAEDTDLHPSLGKKPPLEVLNKDILALPERERQAFIHGAMVQMVAIYSHTKKGAGKCITEWYFEVGNGVEAVQLVLQKYPDYPAVTAIHALSKRACPIIAE